MTPTKCWKDVGKQELPLTQWESKCRRQFGSSYKLKHNFITWFYPQIPVLPSVDGKPVSMREYFPQSLEQLSLQFGKRPCSGGLSEKKALARLSLVDRQQRAVWQ